MPIVAVMGMPDLAPDLLLTYIPHLDYDLQRHGPESEPPAKALDILLGYLTRLKAACADFGYDWIFVGDYAIEPVKRGAIFPNRALREAGLFRVRDIRDMAYTDFFTSPRLCRGRSSDRPRLLPRRRSHRSRARACCKRCPASPRCSIARRRRRAASPIARSGDLVLVAEDGAWFAYPWFEKKEAPDYASHVDIHNKPGYDPCELFFGWPPGSVSFDTTKIHGSHGNVGAGLRDRVELFARRSTRRRPASSTSPRPRSAGWTRDETSTRTRVQTRISALARLASRQLHRMKTPSSSDRRELGFPGRLHPRRLRPGESRPRRDARPPRRKSPPSRDGLHRQPCRRARCPRSREQAAAYFAAHPQQLELVAEPQIVPGGEAVKNDFALVERFMRLMLERASRPAVVRHHRRRRRGHGCGRPRRRARASRAAPGPRADHRARAERRRRRREKRRQFPRRQKRHRHLRPAVRGAERLRLPPHPARSRLALRRGRGLQGLDHPRPRLLR